MVTTAFKHVIAAALASTMAISVFSPAFAAPFPGQGGIRAFAVGGLQPTETAYKRHRSAGVGAAVALGILGLGVAAAVASQNQHRGYDYDNQGYNPGYQPQYAPAYEPQYDPGYQQQYVPGYQQQYVPAYQPRYAPAYQPQYAPAYRDGDGYRRHRGQQVYRNNQGGYGARPYYPPLTDTDRDGAIPSGARNQH